MDKSQNGLLPEVLDALSDPVIMVDGRKVVTFSNAAATSAWPSLINGVPISFTLRTPDLIDGIDRVLAGTIPMIKGAMSERLPVERFFEFQVVSLSSAVAATPLPAHTSAP